VGPLTLMRDTRIESGDGCLESGAGGLLLTRRDI
jgi:hypothetical protein